MAYQVAWLGLWLAFLLIVPTREWRRYYPTLLFTALLGVVADLCGVVYNQWEYIGPTTGGLSLWSDLGFAPPQGGLAAYFSDKYPKWSVLNWLAWILANAIGEWTFVQWGLIRYHQWSTVKATIFYFPFFIFIYLQYRWWRVNNSAQGKIRKTRNFGDL